MTNANNKQVGGAHYQGGIQPWDFIISNNLGYLEGTAIKYLARWRKKNGIEDLQKAIHFIEKLIEVERSRINGVVEPVANLSGASNTSSINGAMGGLLHVHDVGEQNRYSHPIWAGELNDTIILRKDV